jgi:uncharacterized membrane protein
MTVNRSSLLAISAGLWAVFVGLSFAGWNGLNLLNIVGFTSLVVVPGLLITLTLRAGYNLPFWVRIGQAMGLSLLAELLWVLLCNTLLPHLHVRRPLDHTPLLIELSILNFGIYAWSWPRLRYLNYFITRRKISKSRLDVSISLLPFLLVGLAVMGAASLNNGGTNLFTLVMLGLACLYLFTLLALRHRLADTTISWGLYAVSLSLLLMTSMRGWYITGHDIQHEYLVFRLTASKGVWNIANFRDPYNSCLSITILPTIFFNTLHIGSQYVYKILFQVIFGTVPVLIYQLMRLYLSKAKSLLAVIYFISFPTYFTDMTFLNRQEIAFLFLILMMLFILSRRIALRKRQWLFMAFGLGVVLSHYSTTYSMLLIFAAALTLRIILMSIMPRLHFLHRVFKHSSIDVLQGQKQILRAITVPMVAALIVAAFLWNVVLTDTASGAATLISQVADTLQNGVNAGTRSNDVSYSLLSSASVSPQVLLSGYIKNVDDPQMVGAPSGTYYPDSVTKAYYPLTVGSSGDTPLTALGRFLEEKKLNVSNINDELKQGSAKLVQILVGIGLLYIIFSNGFGRAIDTDYFTLTLGAGIFVALQVIVPFLSEAYGILRAFQQSLMVLSMYLVAGTFAIGRIFRRLRPVSLAIPVVLALGFFLATTGVISEVLGGYQAQLQLNNSGTYYDEYYMHAQELAADTWLVANIVKQDPHVNVQTDLDTAIRLDANTGYQAQNDIMPSFVKTYSYVLLGYNDTVKKQVFISYDGDTLTYKYPVQFLNSNKNLIYSNGGSEIYQ